MPPAAAPNRRWIGSGLSPSTDPLERTADPGAPSPPHPAAVDVRSQQRGDGVRLLELRRVAGARDHGDLGAREHGRHPLGDRAELLVALADGERDRDGQRRAARPRAAPSRRCRGRAARRRGPPACCAAGRRCAAAATRSGWPSHSGSAAHSRAKASTPIASIRSASASSAARRAARSAGVGDPRARPDEHEPVEPVAERERGVQRDPAAHRVAREREALAAERAHVARAGGERGGPGGGVAVPRQVRRERPPAAAERGDHAAASSAASG